MLLDFLFSDRRRLAKLGLAVGVSVALGGWYSHLTDTVQIAWPQCAADPARFDGTLLTMPMWRVTAIDGPDRYEVSWVIPDVPVQGPTADLALGQTVSVVGTFSAAGPVVLEQFHVVHRLRRVKVALGALGMLAALAAAPLGLRLRGGRLEQRAELPRRG